MFYSATSRRYVADKVWRAPKEEEVKGRERSEMAKENGEGASEAEGLVEGLNDTWMPCVPTVQSRYEAASSKSVRSNTLTHNIPYQYHTII
jgi:hypothetical protein